MDLLFVDEKDVFVVYFIMFWLREEFFYIGDDFVEMYYVRVVDNN